MILREQKPENLEFPFPSLSGVITPNESFFVRSHFPTPEANLRKWRLSIDGDSVERPCEINYEELEELPTAQATVTLECAGNGRAFIPSKQDGVQWGSGAVGTSEWSGVWLRDVVARSGLKSNAREVVFVGADRGQLDDAPKTPGTIQFSHSIPIEKARADVLLALKMNGEVLPLAHGFPLRAIVPGWYGMASVKWITRIAVISHPFHGYFQTVDYSYWAEANGLPPQMRPITEMEVKAQIARPALHEVVPANSTYRVHGAAWSGEVAIRKVEVSVDGGVTWANARLAAKAVPHIWTLWEWQWRTPRGPGECVLQARATDERGRTQPLEQVPQRGGYLVNFITSVPVKIR